MDQIRIAEITQRPSESRIAVLDGFRALSIGLVLFAHCVIYANHAEWLRQLGTASGSIGVTFFFVLSGYLITSLLIKEYRTTGTVSLAHFYARRGLRIVPAYGAFILVLLALVLCGLLPRLVARDAFISMAFARNLVGRTHETAHLWSLSLEEQFYCVWPMAFLFLFRWKPIASTVVAIAALIMWRCVLWQASGISVGSLYMRTDMRFDSLLFGCLLALLMSKSSSRPISSAHGFTPLAIIALAGALCVAMWADRLVATYLLKHSLVSALAAIGIYAITRNTGGWLVGVFSWSPVVFVGRLSYSLYLWQQLFLGPLDSGMAPIRSSAILGLAITFTVAIVSFYFVETPFLRLKSHLRGPNSLQPPGADSSSSSQSAPTAPAINLGRGESRL